MTCVDCNAGQGSDQWSTGYDDCAPGKYSPVDGRPCGYCADGTYQPGAGKIFCIVCPSGLLSDHTFQFCTSCKPGEIVRNKTACVLCTPGHHAPSAQTGECLSCTAGFHTAVPEGAERCTACAPGSFSELNSVNCSVCPIGLWSGFGFGSCSTYEYLGAVYGGYFLASATGSWSFCTKSDDSSWLWLGVIGESLESLKARRSKSNEVVDNSGTHGEVTVCGDINLVENHYYPVLVYYGESHAGASIQVRNMGCSSFGRNEE